VLYYDSHVESHLPDDIDPVDKEIHDYRWMPYLVTNYRLATEASLVPGILAEYRLGNSFDGPPQVTRIEPDLNLPWGGGRDAQFGDMAKHPFYELRQPGDTYFIDNHTSLLRGQIKADYTENYQFRVSPDDSVVILIDGKEAVPYTWYSGNARSAGTLCAPFPMVAGKWVDIEVRHVQQVRTGSHLWVKWSSQSTPEQNIPSSNLRAKKAPW
jgi:hypothetical protein